jgi:predicted amidophosphoribosyltransferase
VARERASIVRDLIEQIVSLLAPPLCAACAGGRSVDQIVCERCERELATAPVVREAGPTGLDLAVSAAPFEGAARRLVHGLKYARRLSLARVAAEAMWRALPDHMLAGTGREPEEPALMVVPVPPAPWRWRWRGFDPAEEIAVALSELTGLPLEPCLTRGSGRRQVGRRRWERLSEPPRVWLEGDPPATALLVDDVWTTGATLSACALALRAGGCRRVIGLTLAHAV